MSDGFNCTKCGEYANPTVYRPGTPERLRMEATRKCRDCSAGDVLGTDDELPGILDSWDAQERLTAWRDAAVARHLAEAGAVHPAVHTPTRIMNYLESHGWVRFNVSDVAILWSHPDVPTARGWSLCMPMTTEAADYSYRVLELVRELWRTSQSLDAEILLEIAQQSDEVAW